MSSKLLDAKPVFSSKMCERCGRSQSSSMYVRTKSIFYQDKYLPICNECIEELLVEHEFDWDFVDKLASNSAFSNFRVDSSYITAVKNAHANLVAYNLAQKGAGVSKGLCMYWPNSSQYSDISTYYTTSETTLTTWRSFCVNKGTHA